VQVIPDIYSLLTAKRLFGTSLYQFYRILSKEAVAEGMDLCTKRCRAQGQISKNTAIPYNKNIP
jgi:hypothetical protein